jgi:hypothetical protein
MYGDNTQPNENFPERRADNPDNILVDGGLAITYDSQK